MDLAGIKRYAEQFHRIFFRTEIEIAYLLTDWQDVLIEPDKRAEYDVKRKRQQEALNRCAHIFAIVAGQSRSFVSSQAP